MLLQTTYPPLILIKQLVRLCRMEKIERNSNIDKAKGLLIFLVVFGHFVEIKMNAVAEIEV